MKNVLVLLLIFINSAIGLAQYAEFSFLNKTTHKWEKTKEGKQLTHYFVFKNSSEVPLIINDALVSCSCTSIDFPSDPILPNQKDSILVQFDTNQKYYLQDRKIKLIANTKKEEELRIKVYVIPKDE
ncbi:DUF1573 domain-containing protein [Brumimicrobium aurantiacum]|uniref:DUF1573 domain-containing protein n=1 Tax=Brumimicrobium aurantiacum TaxID=1737063 RepID=A0A3E1F0Y9_9FLAO|nr:DUF1573 domain-containing protein [Brumimicrobium aurantiacum]RFC55491.1 DUF1573 domain-containing protein [Brumimicrobium aurantiacum]